MILLAPQSSAPVSPLFAYLVSMVAAASGLLFGFDIAVINGAILPNDRLLRLVGAHSGFLSSNDPREHFGLGAATKADELTVTWADGRVERFTDLAAGHLHTIEDRGGEGPSRVTTSALDGSR